MGPTAMQPNDEEIKKAKLKAMNLLKGRDYTETALRRKLGTCMYSEEAVDAAVEYVKSYGYVDDLRYAQNYIRSCNGLRSRRDTERRLRDKGVDTELIKKAFESEGFDEDAAHELIKRIILKKCCSPETLDYSGRQKLYAYMYAKGFDIDRVEKTLNELSLDIIS